VDIGDEALYPLMDDGTSMANDDDTNGTFNPQRRLCPDDTCIGVIGDDGRCTVCSAAASADAAAAPVDFEPAGSSPALLDEGGASDLGDTSSGFDPHRKLCRDDGCIGVIGSDGRCSVCGAPGDS
jgi:hypothetical protein